jgi:hypothetical protein
MLHTLAMLGAGVWFGQNGLLWYAKPSDLVLARGISDIGVILFAGFFGYRALSRRGTEAQIEIRKPEDSS